MKKPTKRVPFPAALDLDLAIATGQLADAVDADRRPFDPGIVAQLHDLRWLGLGDAGDRLWCKRLARVGEPASAVLGEIRRSAGSLAAFFDGFTVAGKRDLQRLALCSPRVAAALLRDAREHQQRAPHLYAAFAARFGWPDA